jgi:hypothetical protein
MKKVRNAGNAPRFYEASGSATGFVSKLTKLITEFGVDSFMVENKGGEPVGIAFQFDGLAFRVRPDVEGVRRRLERARRKGRASPETVAWAQSFALLEMQLEAIESGAAKASEVLGGYCFTKSGRTVGEVIEGRTGDLLAGERLMLPRGGDA